MKHFRTLVAAAAAAVLLCGALFAGCAGGGAAGTSDAELLVSDGTRVVVRANAGDGTQSLYSVLEAMQKENKLTFAGSESEYGYYITSVNGVEATDDHYWAVYTTLGTLDGTSYSDAQWGAWEYEGNTLASASYGVSGLPMIEGEYYALVWTAVAA